MMTGISPALVVTPFEQHIKSVKMSQQKIEVLEMSCLSYWGPMTHNCVKECGMIGSGNGLSPARCQASIKNIDDSLSIDPHESISVKLELKQNNFDSYTKWKYHLENGVHLVSASMC